MINCPTLPFVSASCQLLLLACQLLLGAVSIIHSTQLGFSEGNGSATSHTVLSHREQFSVHNHYYKDKHVERK